jgi:ribosomal protein S18 acetylase RimI-like enzyme
MMETDRIEIRPLAQLNPDELNGLVTGYTSPTKYQVSKTETDDQFVLTLELVPMEQPYVKRYDHLEPETLEHYQQVPGFGFSFSAYDADTCVGIVLAEPRLWNKSLWVWELHVAETHRRHGIGRELLEALSKKAGEAGLRTIVCETQNTNMPAVQFYHQAGFALEGIDLSYYTNADFPDGEIAIFMKKKL